MAETDLTKLTPAELVEALIKDNSLASEFDRLNLWQNFDPCEWCDLLSAQPQFIEKAKEFEVGWPGLLQIKPELANKCECWEKFYSGDWCELLKAQPQFADKCTEYNGWEKFDSREWCNLLSAQPQFADKCAEYKVWENFDSSGWSNILKSQPQFADKCTEYNGWKEFNSYNWCNLLSAQSQFADKWAEYNGWENFDSWDWCNLLSVQPQFANKCNWSKMRANNYDEYEDYEYGDFEDWKAEYGVDYSENWRNILLKHPQLTEYFTDVLWDGLSQEDWEVLEAQHPGVFEEKHTLSTLRKLAED